MHQRNTRHHDFVTFCCAQFFVGNLVQIMWTTQTLSDIEYCKQHWQIVILYQDYILPICAGLMSFSTLIFLCFHSRNFIKGNLEITKLKFYCGVIFCSLCLFQLISSTLALPQYCHNTAVFSIF